MSPVPAIKPRGRESGHHGRRLAASRYDATWGRRGEAVPLGTGAASTTVVAIVEVAMRVTPSIAAVLLSAGACQPATTSLSDQQSSAIADTALSKVVTRLSDAVADHDVDLGLRELNSRLIWTEDEGFTTNRDSVESVIRGLVRSMRKSRLDWGRPRVEVHGPDTAFVATTFRWVVIDTLGVTNFVDGACSVVVARTAKGWQIIRGGKSRIPPSHSE